MKFKISEIKQIINEELQRAEKIRTLNEAKEAIQFELGAILNEFKIVSPGDKESLKHLTQDGKKYLESLVALSKKYPDDKFTKMASDFVKIQQQAESTLSKIAFSNEGKPATPDQSVVPGTPKAVVNQIPAGVPASVAKTTGAVEENSSVSLANQKGQNLKPNTPHIKTRSGLKK